MAYAAVGQVATRGGCSGDTLETQISQSQVVISTLLKQILGPNERIQ
jgi:hypothetical protein